MVWDEGSVYSREELQTQVVHLPSQHASSVLRNDVFLSRQGRAIRGHDVLRLVNDAKLAVSPRGLIENVVIS